jgi:hypothetical protein
MSVNISFGSINVNAQETNATVSVGETSQVGWSAHSKNNFGTGMLFGINNSANIINNILDNDAVDSPIMDNDGMQPNQNQSF